MPVAKPETPLCEQFGFDPIWRQAQLALVGLGDYSAEQMLQLHEQVLSADAVGHITERFYARLMRHAQAAALLSSFDLDHLKDRQSAFLREWGLDCGESAYFEERARMAIAHARVGVPLSLYLSAFGVLQGLLLDAVGEQVGDDGQRHALGRLVVQLTTLEIALATEVYQRAPIQEFDGPAGRLDDKRSPLRKQLEQDALTGVSSRTSLLHEMQDALNRAAKTGQPLCLVMADLDYFKAVNNEHGYSVGDQVLQQVAQRIKAVLREFDVVGRFGGEEFVILLENTSHHTAQQIAERLRRRIASEPVCVAERSLQLTISQGLAVRMDGDDARGLLERADAAMHQAKQRGRNCVAEELGDAGRR
jgi:diguanylate cyclase (GGDEF)-like protein